MQLNLLRTPPPRQTLRPYQVDAREKAREEFRKGNKRILLRLDTGAGKTTVAANMIETAVEQGKSVLFLAHRRELITQCSKRLDGQAIDHGVIMAGTDRNAPRKPVQVASKDSLLRRVTLPPADLIFVDEAHLSVAPTFLQLLDAYPDAAVIGLTATPYRLDGKGLARIYKSLIEVTNVETLIEEGHLMRPTVLSTPRPDLGMVKTVKGDYDARGLAAAMDNADLVGDVIEHWKKHANGGRTVVFASGVEHSVHLAERFSQAGIPAAHIDAKTPQAKRDDVLGRLASGELKVVCNVEILTAGWDLPALEVCVLARPTQSLSLYLQMVGRIMRPHPGKDRALVLDHAGCIHDHGLPDEPRSWSLYGPKDGAPPPAPSVTNCLGCFSTIPGRIPICPYCGMDIAADRIRRAAKAGVPLEGRGELVEFTKADLARFKRGRFFELVDEATRMGYKIGWASREYHKEFGVWPGAQWKSELKRRA